LQFNPDKLFERVNESFFETLNCWPSSVGWIYFVGDESMCCWTSKNHRWVICIPRKPQPNGMRVYILVTILNATGRPVVVYLLPDLPKPGSGFLSPRQVIEKMSTFILQISCIFC